MVWSGSGTSGTDPMGNAWQILDNGPFMESVWGIPGNGLGVVGFLAEDEDFVRDFHIQFTNLPADVYIVPTAIGSSSGLTTFWDETTYESWSRNIESASAVSFYAPAGSQLNAGEVFFTNVVFSRTLDETELSDLGFNAEWTDTGAAVPEPLTATLGMMGLGALTLTAARRQRA